MGAKLYLAPYKNVGGASAPLAPPTAIKPLGKSGKSAQRWFKSYRGGDLLKLWTSNAHYYNITVVLHQCSTIGANKRF